MKTIKEIITENQQEFNDVIINFLTEKSVETKQKKKQPKTVCHFSVMGKKYDSNVFTNNYKNFLMDISKNNNYKLFQESLGRFVRSKSKYFSETTRNKSQLVKLMCGGYVSTYSSTEFKIKHIKNICDKLGVDFSYEIK